MTRSPLSRKTTLASFAPGRKNRTTHRRPSGVSIACGPNTPNGSALRAAKSAFTPASNAAAARNSASAFEGTTVPARASVFDGVPDSTLDGVADSAPTRGFALEDDSCAAPVPFSNSAFLGVGSAPP